MELYRNRVCVSFDELVTADGGEPVISGATLQKILYRNPSLRMSRGGGLDNYVRIDYYLLRDTYRARYEAKYGDPSAKIKEMQNKQRLDLTIDTKARAFYEDYRYMKRGAEVSLTDKLIDEYTINASVLNRLISEIDNRAAYRRTRGGSTTGLLSTVTALYEELRDVYAHTLPANADRLKDKIARYRKEGYASLISGKIGNSNTTVITEDAGRYIVALKRSAVPVYNDAQIFAKYNTDAPARGWKPLKSIQSLRQYLNSPAVEPLWYDAVHGELKAHQRYSRKNKTEMPTMRDSLWYGDGTKLNLYYKEYVAGKGWQVKTTQVYEVVDAYSETLLGYCISDAENYESQYAAYRMAVQKSGHKPYELVHDNQGGHNKIGDFLDKIAARLHRPTAPYSGQSKTIESIFGRFQAQVLHKDWRFTGQNITTKKENSRANLERIHANIDKLYTLDELKAVYAKMRDEWNAMAHPATGVSRAEMYANSVNPETPEVTVYDMVDMFWITTKKASTYTDNGIKIKVDKKEYQYEVLTAYGKPDYDFRRHNFGEKFIIKYDPADMANVRLYTKERNGALRFAAIAGPYVTVHRNLQEQAAGDRAFIAANIEANNKARVARQVEGELIALEHGTAPEQQGLNRPRPAGMKKSQAEQIDREIRRRRRKIANAEVFSPGRVTKTLSNATFDPKTGGVIIDMERTLGKLG